MKRYFRFAALLTLLFSLAVLSPAVTRTAHAQQACCDSGTNDCGSGQTCDTSLSDEACVGYCAGSSGPADGTSCETTTVDGYAVPGTWQNGTCVADSSSGAHTNGTSCETTTVDGYAVPGTWQNGTCVADSSSGGKANGQGCFASTECTSGYCDGASETCQTSHTNGAVCDYDSQGSQDGTWQNGHCVLDTSHGGTPTQTRAQQAYDACMMRSGTNQATCLQDYQDAGGQGTPAGNLPTLGGGGSPSICPAGTYPVGGGMCSCPNNGTAINGTCYSCSSGTLNTTSGTPRCVSTSGTYSSPTSGGGQQTISTGSGGVITTGGASPLGTGGAGAVNQQWAQYYRDLIVWIVNSVFVPSLIAIAFIVFLWGVYKYFILGAAEEAGRAEGRQFVMWGIIGLVTILSVWGLVYIVRETIIPSTAGSSHPAYPTL